MNEFRIFIIGLIALLPNITFAEYSSSQMARVGEIYGELVGSMHVYDAYLNGECGQYLPSQFSKNKKNMENAISDVIKMLPEKERQSMKAILANNPGELSRLVAFAITKPLTLWESMGANKEFSCGVVFGNIVQFLKNFEIRISEARDILK